MYDDIGYYRPDTRWRPGIPLPFVMSLLRREDDLVFLSKILSPHDLLAAGLPTMSDVAVNILAWHVAGQLTADFPFEGK